VSTRYLYSARLVPIGKPVRIPFVVDDRPPKVSTFTADTFELERTAKTKPPVLANHDRNLEIGRVVQLYTDMDREWWCAHFTLDRDVPDDVVLEVGQPISVGIHESISGTGAIFLDEVSIVSRSAVKGAEITRRVAIEPAPVVSATRAVPTHTTPDRPAVADVIPIRRAARSRPTTFPRREFERRMDFAIDLAENFGIDGAVEAELEHMQRVERAMQLGWMPLALLRGVR
jgi:hypothetical protein